MAANKQTIVVYKDWKSQFEHLSDEEAGMLIKHFFRYVNDENPEPPNRLIALLFEPIKQSLKRDLVKWEATKETKTYSARLGNLKRWSPDLYDEVIKTNISIDEAENIAKNRKTSQNIANATISDITVTDAIIKSHNVTDATKHSQSIADGIKESQNIANAINPSQTIANIAVSVTDTVTVTDTDILLEKEAKDIYAPKFNFQKSLVALGADKNLVDEWIAVRKTKKATNTQTALKKFLHQVELSGYSLNEVLEKCVEKSWSGFEAEYLNNQNNFNNSKNGSKQQQQDFLISAREAIEIAKTTRTSQKRFD